MDVGGRFALTAGTCGFANEIDVAGRRKANHVRRFSCLRWIISCPHAEVSREWWSCAEAGARVLCANVQLLSDKRRLGLVIAMLESTVFLHEVHCVRCWVWRESHPLCHAGFSALAWTFFCEGDEQDHCSSCPECRQTSSKFPTALHEDTHVTRASHPQVSLIKNPKQINRFTVSNQQQCNHLENLQCRDY